MSLELSSSVRARATEILENIDEDSSKLLAETETRQSIAHGPFSVFKVVDAIARNSTASHIVSTTYACESVPLQPFGSGNAAAWAERPDRILSEDFMMHPSDLVLDMAFGGDDTHILVDANEIADEEVAFWPSLTAQITPEATAGNSYLDATNLSSFARPLHNDAGSDSGAITNTDDPNSSISSFRAPCHSVDRVVPDNAGFLLSHFKNHIVGLLSPLKHHPKKPWDILQLPCAMSVLAELTMHRRPNHAKYTVFYALLSVSAFNLRSMSSGSAGNYWTEVGNEYNERAHQSLKLSLARETGLPKRAKYKEILMAILSMAMISVRRFQFSAPRVSILL